MESVSLQETFYPIKVNMFTDENIKTKLNQKNGWEGVRDNFSICTTEYVRVDHQCSLPR